MTIQSPHAALLTVSSKIEQCLYIFFFLQVYIFFCNTAWPQYLLDSGEKQSINTSINQYTTLQLHLFCKREKKQDEIPYVPSFMFSEYLNKPAQKNVKFYSNYKACTTQFYPGKIGYLLITELNSLTALVLTT